ncbi:MAG: hypothetical protein LBS46_00085 [Dysgonamonadaceae bacterium]|jgi:hypothetical protein|nr:hypothetical protein [Dysgonamonadaceae bacterium]
MRKHSFWATIVAIIFSINGLQSQEAFKHWAIGVEGGTFGPGITCATSLSPNFKLRAGVDFLGLSYNESIDFNNLSAYLLETPSTTTPLSGVLSSPKLDFTHFKTIVDYYPMKNGVFSLSAGFYWGSSLISTSAKIDNYPQLVNELGGSPVLDLSDDITIKPKADGSFDAKLQLGNFVKPYVGLGLGRTIANSRLAFKFDLGIVYQGDYKIESQNIISKSGQTPTNAANDLLEEFPLPPVVFKIWPMINFGLSYRIF